MIYKSNAAENTPISSAAMGVGGGLPPQVVEQTTVNLVPIPAPEQPDPYAKSRMLGIVGRTAGAATLFGGLIAAGYALHEAPDVDLKRVDVAAIGRQSIDGLETVSPYVLGAAGLIVLGMGATRPGRTRLTLAHRGLSPHDAATRGMKRVVAGAALPALTATTIATGLMIDHGIRDGANRAVDSMASSVQEMAGPDQAVTWVFRPGTKHFMNQSHITAATVAEVQEALPGSGITAIEPYKTDLTMVPTANSESQAGLKIAVENEPGSPSVATPKVAPDAVCEVVDERCVLGPNDLIVDRNEGLKIGDTTTIHDQTYTVVAHPTETQSLLDRLFVYSGISDEERKEGYSGFVAISDAETDVEELIQREGLAGELDPLTTDEFRKYNEEFWSGNGTPLIVIMEGSLLLVGAGLALKTARDERNNSRSQLATLRAVGFSKKDILQIRTARAAMHTFMGTAAAYPMQAGMEHVVNGVMTGFKVGLTPYTVAATAALMLGVQTGGSLLRQGKGTLAEEMRIR